MSLWRRLNSFMRLYWDDFFQVVKKAIFSGYIKSSKHLTCNFNFNLTCCALSRSEVVCIRKRLKNQTNGKLNVVNYDCIVGSHKREALFVKRNNLERSIGVISSDPLFIECHVRFTNLPYTKLCLVQYEKDDHVVFMFIF